MKIDETEESKIVMQMLALAATGIDDEGVNTTEHAAKMMTRLCAAVSMAIGGSFAKEYMVEAVVAEFSRRLKAKSIEFHALTHGGPLDPKNLGDAPTTTH